MYIKRFERSNGLDTALYKKTYFFFINQGVVIPLPVLVWQSPGL